MDVQKKITQFPDAPGVYLMKDRRGAILYVGKATSLKKRVSSYFRKPAAGKTQALLEHIAQIEYIRTSSSAQALLLENALIKRYQPYYNAALKDDKSYPYVQLSAEEFPRLSITRGKKETPARYYGPYTNVKLLKAAIKTMRAIFPFRSCRRLPKRACLYLDLKLCPGMCVQKIDRRIYRKNLRQLGLFLEGKHSQLLKELKQMMLQAARNQQFEQAAFWRDRLNCLSETIRQTKEISYPDVIRQLQTILKLPQAPDRIEAFDISEIAGTGVCGAMVSFLGGWPDKQHYRKFRIKTVTGIDDYAMIRELLRRRYSKIGANNIPALPDLVMIDGGKGHLSSARQELAGLGLKQLPVIALAKRRETIYTTSGQEINLAGDSQALHLLQRIRDEVHRFAITYHRKLRQKKMHSSALDEIADIGPKRKKALLLHFKSVPAIKQATVQDLLKVKGINRKAAQNIVDYYQDRVPTQSGTGSQPNRRSVPVRT